MSRVLSTAVLPVGTAVFFLALLFLLSARRAGDTDAARWREHRERIAALPEEPYHLDRFRDVRGRVTGPDGRPVEGGRVVLFDLESIVAWVELPGTSLARLVDEGPPVELETRTGRDGRFVFAHPGQGAKSICYLADGLAPARRDLLIVRDGVSNWYADADLEVARSVDVVLPDGAVADGTEVVLLDRWWPRPPRGVARDGRVTLTGVGGDLRRGRLFARIGDGVEEIGAWSLEPTVDDEEVTAPERPDPPLGPGGQLLPSSRRLDAAAVVTAARRSAPRPLASYATEPVAGGARLHGFVEAAFLPVRAVEDATGVAVETFATRAGEYAFDGLAPGAYRVEAFARLDLPVFSRLAVLPPGGSVDVHFGLGDRVDEQDPRSRILQGLVRYEDGTPAIGVPVFCQDVSSFRRYLRRQEVGEAGDYRCANVEAGRSYVVFALPEDKDSIKAFTYATVAADARETRHDLTVHRQEIRARAPAGRRVALERRRDDGGWDAVWFARAGDDGRVRLAYLPPAVYRVVDADAEVDGAGEGAASVFFGPGEPVPFASPASEGAGAGEDEG